MSGAARQRRRRQRLRAGDILLTVCVREDDVVAALIETGDLAPAHAEDRAAIARALERLLSRVTSRGADSW